MAAILMANVGRLIPMSISRKSLRKISSLFRLSSSLADVGNTMKTEPPIRRSGNYQPPIWDFQFIHSLDNPYAGDEYMKRFNELKKEMKKKLMVMVDGSIEELDAKLELIDNLQRLGVSYHFKDEIMQILKSVHDQIISSTATKDNSLYSTTLKLRVFRQHGFHISQDILNDFKDEHGNFKQSLCEDTKGLLQLYEASFLSTECETSTLLESANTFALSHLKKYLNGDDHQENGIVELVRHAMELPLHCMMLRVETRWYINIYEKIFPNANPLLLELAKLDFNIVQATHQQDLRNLSRWWKNTRLAEKMPFSRDRIVEAFLWIAGMMFEPQKNENCRIMLTKVIAMATVIDDIYDVYGTLDELEIFTHAIQSGQICANRTYKKQDGTTLVDISQVWKNTWIMHGSQLQHPWMKWKEEMFQCYMNEKGASEEDARKHILNFMIKETWKLMNTAQRHNSLFSETFIGCAVNAARTSHTIYQHGDGHGIANSQTKNRIFQLFFEHITISLP